jgi:spore maturation protein SpmA/spore maturation protein SpmB
MNKPWLRLGFVVSGPAVIIAASCEGIYMLNGLWLGFFVVAAISALAQWLIGGNAGVFAAMVESIFAMAKLSVEVMVLLFGTLTLWLGFLNIADKAGIVDWLGKVLAPLFHRLMPEVPRGHPALGLITLNFAANALGLDNAATPIGLKAMRSLQELNPSKTVASNAQILFLVLNASSLTLLPVTIFMYRAQQGAADPTMVFLPILLATSASTLVGLLSVAFMQRLKLWDPVVLAYLVPGALLLGGFMAVLAGLSATALSSLSSVLGNVTLFGIIMLFLVIGALRKVKVYETFVEGAKEGFDVAKNLLPYLVAMLCAVGVLRASGALDFILEGIRHGIQWMGMDTRFVDALPTALVKPFSGSAARAMLIETMKTQGVDSFPALVAATIQGSTETTFYVLAVYFGAVGIQRARHAVGCALLAEFAGVVAAIAVCYWFFGSAA